MTKFTQSYREYYRIIDEVKLERRNKVKDRLSKNYKYFEEHHIIPRSLGGSNKKSNLVLLTPEEHYICHSLLPDFCDGEPKAKMIYAWNMLNNTRDINGGKIIGPEKYGELKRAFSKKMSKLTSRLQQEINDDPIRKENRSKKLKQYQKNLRTDPIRWRQKQALHSKRAKQSWSKIKLEEPKRAKEIIKKRVNSLKKTIVEKRKDPIKMEFERQRRSIAAKKFQSEINADPIRTEKRRLNRIGVTDKAVVHLDENWNWVDRYSSIKIAAEKLGYSGPVGISHNLRGRSKAYRGQHWVYEKDVKRDLEGTIKRAKKISEAFTKKIIQLDMSNNITDTFKSVISARNKLKIDPSIIIKVLLGEMNSYENKKWKFKI